MLDLLTEIKCADESAIEEILNAVLHRYAELFPDWEVNTISLQRSQDRNEQLDRIIAMLQNMKTSRLKL